MFALNLQAWKHNPYIKERYHPDEIGELGSRLSLLAGEGDRQSDITWQLRQIALRRG
jgi:hypothetical protein